MKKIMLCAAFVVASFGFANAQVVKCTEKKCEKTEQCTKDKQCKDAKHPEPAAKRQIRRAHAARKTLRNVQLRKHRARKLPRKTRCNSLSAASPKKK